MFKKGDKKIINAWATFDLSNSVYNLVITATIFPIFYDIVTTTKVDGEVVSRMVSFLGFEFKNTTLYDYAIAFAYLVVVVLTPILSGIADYGGNKKRFMQFFTLLGSLSCSLMYFFNTDTLYLGISLSVLACIGYAGGLVFYNAYLPEIADVKDHDKVSAKGFAVGYAGSAVLLIIVIVLIQTATSDEIKFLIMKWSFVAVGIWWFLFSRITFYYLPDIRSANFEEQSKNHYLSHGFIQLKKVWGSLKHTKQLKRFLVAFFVYSMGVQTIMLVATHFGKQEVHMETGQLITTILIIQFVAMAGAYLFSFLSKIKGNIFTLKLATLIWSLVCVFTYFFVYTPNMFYITAAFVGLVMGGTQSLSRSTYSKMLPETDNHTSYFSFYDVCEKLSIVFGMLSFGFINEISDTMRTPILVIISFFVLGFLLLYRVEKINVKI